MLVCCVSANICLINLIESVIFSVKDNKYVTYNFSLWNTVFILLCRYTENIVAKHSLHKLPDSTDYSYLNTCIQQNEQQHKLVI